METVFLVRQETYQDSFLKTLHLYLFCSLFFISCNNKTQQEKELVAASEIIIPSIEQHKNNRSFKLKNGVLFFNKTPYSGIVNDFYSEGTLKSTAEYYKGKRYGKYYGWYKNGNKWFQRIYKDGLKIGVHKGWHLNENQMFEYHFNYKGFYNGSVKDWFSNGILAKSFNFIEGKESGSQKMWNTKGKIRANFYTVNGERHGLIGLKKCISVIH